ncbi:hypothetical protein DAMA08_033670 [Martiniozyma asiatica (nom. inval.)]|nr:hypothetical protein DAMA08_033670 [Martiniozyma asiatica]
MQISFILYSLIALAMSAPIPNEGASTGSPSVGLAGAVFITDDVNFYEDLKKGLKPSLKPYAVDSSTF